MTTEEQIAELQAHVAALQAVIDGEPTRTAETVAAAVRSRDEALDAKEANRADMETQLSAAQGQIAALQADLSAAESARAAAVAELSQWKLPAGSIITPAELQRRINPVYGPDRLFSLTGPLFEFWNRVLKVNVEQTQYKEIYLTDTKLIEMVRGAQLSGLLTEAEADAVLAHTGA